MSFEVTYERDEDGWHAFIPLVPGCHTWGRSLSIARKKIRQALELFDDVTGLDEQAVASVVLVDNIKVPGKARAPLRTRARIAVKAGEVEKELRERTHAAARALLEVGLSLRDAAELLGLSQQGVRWVLGETIEQRPKVRARKAHAVKRRVSKAA